VRITPVTRCETVAGCSKVSMPNRSCLSLPAAAVSRFLVIGLAKGSEARASMQSPPRPLFQQP
jgi:hypothetical protein